MAYIYIVRCEDDSLYTGITKDLGKRMKSHAHGSGKTHAKYMRSHTPKELMAVWQTEEYKVAAKLEYAIKKKLTRQQKLWLIDNRASVKELFPDLEEFDFVPLDGLTLEGVLGDE